MSEKYLANAKPDASNVNELMGILADGERRETLAYLLERDADGPVGVGAVADHVSGENEASEAVFRSLYHAHLPRLADAGVVAYERTDETVRLVGGRQLVEDVLDAAKTF